MNCTECKEMLAAYIEGLVEETERVELEEHLDKCQLCRQELQEFRALHQKLAQSSRNWQQTDIENGVMKKVIREQSGRLKETSRVKRRLDIWRTIMTSRITKLAAAAVIAIAVLFGIGQFFGGTVTFAQVIEPILNARSLTFDFIVGQEEGGPVIHDIVAGNRIRRTFSNMETILILDLDNAKMLTLVPSNKSATYMDIKGPIGEQTKNFMEFVRNAVVRLEGHEVEKLGRKKINGRNAVGFQVRGHNEGIKIWADSETAMPIRIELRFGQTRYILKNIEFDVPVDESLLSMDVPAGYILCEQEIDLSQFSELDFVITLRIMVQYYYNGIFPDSLGVEDFMDFVGHVQAEANEPKMSEEEQVQIGMHFARGFMFFQQMGPSGIQWRYIGKGVKLGEADKAVFWYKPRGSKTYRVIYGDLSVREVLPQDLPK
jgi:outer membrane lipoprotein-sorting protein